MNDQNKKFFDKKTPEEDLPVEIEESIQLKYLRLNQIFEEFFEENTITLAKVIYIIIKAKFERRKRNKEA